MDSEPTLPDKVVPELWFECIHQEGCRDYLANEPWHTFPGRMQAWCETRGVRFRVSRSELPAILPDATRYWVQGFLTGNTPRQPDVEDGGPAIAEWRRLAEEFLATGNWPSGLDNGLVNQWREDAQVVADIGRALAGIAMPSIEVRLPRNLAEKALAAWARDDEDGPVLETRVQRLWRHRAATLALIGLAVEEQARTEADPVLVEMDIALVLDAIQAAEE